MNAGPAPADSKDSKSDSDLDAGTAKMRIHAESYIEEANETHQRVRNLAQLPPVTNGAFGVSTSVHEAASPYANSPETPTTPSALSAVQSGDSAVSLPEIKPSRSRVPTRSPVRKPSNGTKAYPVSSQRSNSSSNLRRNPASSSSTGRSASGSDLKASKSATRDASRFLTANNGNSSKRAVSPSKIPQRRKPAASSSSSVTSSEVASPRRRRGASPSKRGVSPSKRNPSPAKRSSSPSKPGRSHRSTAASKGGGGSSQQPGLKRDRSINLLFQPEPLSDEEVEDDADSKRPQRPLLRRRSSLLIADDQRPSDHSPELWKIFDDHEEYQENWESMGFDHGDVLYQERMQFYCSLEQRMAKLDQSTLSEADQLNFKAFLPFISSAKKDVEHAQWQLDCTVRKGPHVAFANYCRKRTFKSKADMQRWAQAAGLFAKAVQLRIRMWKDAVKAKRTMSVFVVRGIITQLAARVRCRPENSIWFRPLRLLKDKALYDQLYAPVTQVITDTIQPTLETMKMYLEREYMAACTKHVGLWATPGGAAYYTHLVRFFTTEENIMPHTVHEIGVREVRRLKAEITALFEKMGHKRNTFTQLIDVIDDSPEYFFAAKESPLKAYSKFLQFIKPNLSKYFGKEPSNRIVVRGMQSGTAAAALYALGDPGVFYVNTLEPEQRPKYMVPAIALHEGVGHHYQLSIAHEMRGVPEFRRKRGLNVAFAEGWGVYLEYLGDEMGAYTDDIMQLGRLNGEILRASRLVVETGIHVRRWTRAHAVQWLKDHTFLKAVELDSEVNRAILTPGHGLAYTIGLLKIRQLRDMATRLLGDHFDLREFHDTMLSEGALPLYLLDENMCKWMKTKAQEVGIAQGVVDTVFSARVAAEKELQSTAAKVAVISTAVEPTPSSDSDAAIAESKAVQLAAEMQAIDPSDSDFVSSLIDNAEKEKQNEASLRIPGVELETTAADPDSRHTVSSDS